MLSKLSDLPIEFIRICDNLSINYTGKIFNKAIELARSVNPEQVVELEEEWGDSLVENKQSDAAINHYIEAGCTKKALEAAVSARQWKKAMHIIQVIEDTKSVAKYYDLIANYFASIKVR